MLTAAQFIIRNPGYSIKNVRRLWSVRKAMREHIRLNPCCAYCGREKGLHCHHIEPVSVSPEKADEPTNLISLCGKRCHITIGHMGNWNTWNRRCVLTCRVAAINPSDP